MAIQFYKNNRKLKASGVKIGMTKHQVQELLKCAADPVYFCEKYVKIVTMDKGIQPFNPHPFQKEIIQTLGTNRKVIVKCPRQVGKSTVIAAYMVHYVLFNKSKAALVLAHQEKTSKDILNRIKIAYENIPFWMQQGVVEWNKTSIEFENGSSITASATSGGAARGQMFNLILMDEMAHIEANVAAEFFDSVYPTMSSGTTSKMVIVSTPKGLNMFYRFWEDAKQKKNGFVPIEVHWSNVPGRTPEWAEEQRKALGDIKFSQEFECEFIGSSHTLIAASKLRVMGYADPFFHNEEGLRVYKEPKEGNTYVLTVDIGSGVELDYSAISIFDITTSPYEQVATFRNNTINPLLLPNTIKVLAEKYYRASVLVELNNEGSQVANLLYYDLEYENILTVNSSKGRQELGGGFGRDVKLGITMSKQTKRVGCTNLKALIENDVLIVNDFHTYAELMSFVADGDSFAADEGSEDAHDDMVMTLVSFAWIVNQQYFKEMMDLDVRKKMFAKTVEDMEENMLPFGNIIGGAYDDFSAIVEDGAVWSRFTF
jgi:hypothetical protein